MKYLYTKEQIVREFKNTYWRDLTQLDKITKNEMFWQWVDNLRKQGYISESQWRRWANPF